MSCVQLSPKGAPHDPILLPLRAAHASERIARGVLEAGEGGGEDAQQFGFTNMNDSIQDPEWYPILPQGWRMSRVKAVFENFDSGVWGEDPYDDDSSTPVIRSNEIDEGGNWRVTTPALRLLSPTEKGKARLREGDLLIVKSSGSHAHIGKTAVVTREIEDLGSCFSNFTGRIRVLSGRANSRFLWYFLNNSPGRDQLFYYGTTTTGLINLSATSIGGGVLAGWNALARSLGLVNATRFILQ
jgi:hypothetical protein